MNSGENDDEQPPGVKASNDKDKDKGSSSGQEVKKKGAGSVDPDTHKSDDTSAEQGTNRGEQSVKSGKEYEALDGLRRVMDEEVDEEDPRVVQLRFDPDRRDKPKLDSVKILVYDPVSKPQRANKTVSDERGTKEGGTKEEGTKEGSTKVNKKTDKNKDIEKNQDTKEGDTEEGGTKAKTPKGHQREARIVNLDFGIINHTNSLDEHEIEEERKVELRFDATNRGYDAEDMHIKSTSSKSGPDTVEHKPSEVAVEDRNTAHRGLNADDHRSGKEYIGNGLIELLSTPIEFVSEYVPLKEYCSSVHTVADMYYDRYTGMLRGLFISGYPPNENDIYVRAEYLDLFIIYIAVVLLVCRFFRVSRTVIRANKFHQREFIDYTSDRKKRHNRAAAKIESLIVGHNKENESGQGELLHEIQDIAKIHSQTYRETLQVLDDYCNEFVFLD